MFLIIGSTERIEGRGDFGFRVWCWIVEGVMGRVCLVFGEVIFFVWVLDL